jgi:acyl-CoA dehydrogenase
VRAPKANLVGRPNSGFIQIMKSMQLERLAAWSYARDPLCITECSMGKLKAAEPARSVAEECRHLPGADGFREGSDIVHIVHDAQAAAIPAGAGEVIRDTVAQSGYEESR